jgi:hypothetical protein
MIGHGWVGQQINKQKLKLISVLETRKIDFR